MVDLNPEVKINFDILKEKLSSTGRRIKAIVEQGRAIATDPSQLFLFKGMYKELKPYFDIYNDTWDNIVQLVADKGGAAIFPDKSDRTNQAAIERYYYEACAIYEDKMNPTPVVQSSISQSSGSAGESAGLNDSRTVRARLPQINLPKFSGNPAEWPLFRDTYISLIHQESSLSDMEKFLFLVSCLSGPPRSLIGNVALNEQNYGQAWKLLLEHYNNKRKLANTYLKQILDFKPITGKPSPASLKSIITSVMEYIDSFSNLGIPNQGDFIKSYLILRCLDPITRGHFEKKYVDSEFPSYSDLVHFIKTEWKAMDLYFTEAEPSSSSDPQPSRKPFSKGSQRNTFFQSNQSPDHKQSQRKSASHHSAKPCPVCKNAHSLYHCQEFRTASPSDKLKLLKDWPGCTNCLSGKHSTKECTSLRRCSSCNGNHHSWLHQQTPLAVGNTPAVHVNRDNEGFALSGLSGDGEVLLGTVVLQVKTSKGHFATVRAVTDSGSQMSFITTDCAKRLGVIIKPSDQNIAGIGQIKLTCPVGKADCLVKSSIPSLSFKEFSVRAIVVPKITGNLPQSVINKTTIDQLKGYALADPAYWHPGPVEFLLGGDLFFDILTGQPIVLNPELPRLVPTIFGFVVAGPLASQPKSRESMNFLIQSNVDLNDAIHKFWEMEEVLPVNGVSEEDEYCEKHYQETHYRLDSGRYVISLPAKPSIQSLQDTRGQAFKRLLNLEAKLAKNAELKKEYSKFMRDYLDLGHMKLVDNGTAIYTLPHHCVTKVQDGQLKLRTVFDASCKSATGSLNDHLYVGPNLQHDIRDILTNFRCHEVVFSADIVKMYRQILVTPEDRRYQHILWRFDPSEEVREYELCTVTYGESSAPFSALRTIIQLVQDEGSSYPLASKALLEDIYVDDVATGAATVEEALSIQTQLVELLGKGCFTLSKWASNKKELLVDPREEDCQLNAATLTSDEEPKIKLLGMQWIPKCDFFTYEISAPSWQLSKRAVLSSIARIYDPLGFLAPIVFYAKTILQDLWIAKCEWDERLPPSICTRWYNFLCQLSCLSDVKIPRCIVYPNSIHSRLVGFSDASKRGYSAVIYLVTSTSTTCHVNLLKAKTKLAPTKTMTIPRLELSGALLLSKLFKSCEHLVKKLELTEVDFYTDSEVVLGWLSMSTQRLNAFVAHRVVLILELTNLSQWHYVKSEENPADCSSRGILPSDLPNHPLWWAGPSWLSKLQEQWPSHKIEVKDLPETKKDAIACLNSEISPVNDYIEWMERFSSYTRLLNSARYVLRFILRCRKREGLKKASYLAELRQANKICIKITQDHYKLDKNQLQSLNPFIDSDGILKVGGRLRHAVFLSHDARHPIILSGKSHLARLIVHHTHRSLLHVGPSALQSILRSKYWITSSRSLIRQRVFQCIKCFKEKKKPQPPIMGDLPACRLAEGQVFTHVGVDFGGPFLIRESSRRKAAVGKAYLCLFICMSTKAVHLEVVSRCYTDAFLAAFDRFIARRGKPSQMYSDGGTNFVGASNKLREIQLWQRSSSVQERIESVAAHQDIKWTFNPPSSSHFGGVWEAVIKSAKARLNRVAGDTRFTFEELATIFCRVEAILNSRPLTALDSDPSSLECITPGHFLIGKALTSAPEEDLSEEKVSPLRRWDIIKQRTQHFWKRWKTDYLSTLQQRSKWTKKQDNIHLGDLVIIKDPNATVMRWPLSRVITLHPGKDGVVRVVTIQTSSGTYKRPVAKLLPLSPANYRC